MEKVICYYRVSTKGQGESGLGLEAQKAYIEHFVKSSGNYEIIQEFTEIASGKNMDCKKRPLLCEALELCRKHGYLLAVAKLDRLSRTTSHILNIFETLEGRLISCDIPNLRQIYTYHFWSDSRTRTRTNKHQDKTGITSPESKTRENQVYRKRW
jgi:DNA invertase Pin-like site-specific DNA recombinase